MQRDEKKLNTGKLKFIICLNNENMWNKNVQV